MKALLVRVQRVASLFLILLAGTCGFDYDGAFSEGGTTSGTSGASSSQASGGGGGATSSVSGQGGVAGAGGGNSSSSCVEPVLPCGTADGACCICGVACEANLVCDGAACRCSAAGEPCCGGTACDAGLVCAGGTCAPCGEVNTPCCASSVCNSTYLNCIGGTCLNCCGQCKAVDSQPVKHNFAATGGDCNQAVKDRCRNVNGCNGGSPPNCCSTNCVTVTGFWGVCP